MEGQHVAAHVGRALLHHISEWMTTYEHASAVHDFYPIYQATLCQKIQHTFRIIFLSFQIQAIVLPHCWFAQFILCTNVSSTKLTLVISQMNSESHHTCNSLYAHYDHPRSNLYYLFSTFQLVKQSTPTEGCIKYTYTVK